MLTSPVTREVRRRWPKAEIEFLTRSEYAALAGALPGVSRVKVFEPDRGLSRLIFGLRGRRYDLAIDLHGNIRSRMVGLAGGARRVVRYDKQRLARMAVVSRPGGSASVPHTVDRYLAVLDLPGSAGGFQGDAGSEPERRRPELHVDGRAAEEVEDRLAGAGIGPHIPVIGVAPGASHGPKRWPPRKFARVAGHMARSRETKIVLLGSKADRKIAGEVAKAMDHPVLDWTGTTDLVLLPAAIKRCQLLLSNDSGPMHVATAVGTPVIGLFGATHPRLGFGPLGPADAAVTLDLPCSPCSLHGDRACRFRTHACMEDLSAEEVIAVAERRLTE